MWDYALMRAYDNLEKYRCNQCGGYVWECNEKISKQSIRHEVKVATCTKTIARDTERGRVSHSHQNKLSNKKGIRAYTPDPTIGKKWYTKSLPKKAGLRMPSYADWILFNLYEDV